MPDRIWAHIKDGDVLSWSTKGEWCSKQRNITEYRRVVRAKAISNGGRVARCSNCRNGWTRNFTFAFCPYCGATLEGES